MGDSRKAWFYAGLAAATLVCVLSGPARAQQSTTLPAGQTLPNGSSGTVNGRGQLPDTDESYAAPGIPPPTPKDDPSETPDEIDPLDPQPRAGQRPVLQDGDPNTSADQLIPQDGIVDVGEPLPPEDGTDPSVVDTRSQDEIDVFENPPAGFDPLLFQIEDLDPMTQNIRPDRLFRAEPYDPIGIRIGSFLLFPEVQISGSAYSNVFRSPEQESDVAIDFVPSARLVSNWSTHALEFRARGGLSYFSEFDTENDKSYFLESRGRFDVSKRTNIQGLISREQTLESRAALNASSLGPRTKQVTESAEAALNHRFNRLSVQIRGSVDDFSFSDGESLGVPVSNSDRNYTAYEETVRATWEFKPTLSAFTEVAINQREYDQVAATDGYSRSSDGERYRVGLSFGNTGKVWRGEVSLGFGKQTPDDKRLESIDGLIVDANVAWRVSEKTSFLFNARSDVTETTTPDVGGALGRIYGIEVQHAIQRYLIGSAGLTYSTQTTDDGFIDENELRATLGLEYYANRETILFGNYAHSSFSSTDGLTDFDSDEVRMGVRLRR